MKVNVFTSYFAKMAKREKQWNDVYVQVSRTVYCPLKALSGKTVQEEIDYEFSEELGNYGPLEEYEADLPVDAMDNLVDFLKPENWQPDEANKNKEAKEVNIFLLCFENLESKYTKKDVEKYGVKEGDYKKCHRTIIAKTLLDQYGIKACEY